MKKLLIANRGEIAIRIARGAQDMGLETVAIYSEDDAQSLHTQKSDIAVPLQGQGVAAYLDQTQIIEIAKAQNCDGIHPGYGFLSENADFADACDKAGIKFVGPTADQLRLFGDKANARALAAECGVPLLPGTEKNVDLELATAFMAGLGIDVPVLVKAVAGGGGRGMRIVNSADELATAMEQASREAEAAFGDGSIYLEKRITRARHIEVQIIGDGQDVTHLWERECTLQRNHQKLVEIAPSPSLNKTQQENILTAAKKMASKAGYQSLGTFEFLVNADSPDEFYFIEANPRLQVEHTVTEMVTGVDLLQSQLAIASGASLKDLGLDVPTKGFSIQTRVNLESLTPEGKLMPASGRIICFEAPTGPGIRVDHFGYTGYNTSTRYDSLLAKLIVHSPLGYENAVAKTQRALKDFRIEGVKTNIPFFTVLYGDKRVVENEVYTRFVDDHLEEMAALLPSKTAASQASNDALAVLHHSKTTTENSLPETSDIPEGKEAVITPLQGTIIELSVSEGDTVSKGQQIALMEAMKMEHVLTSPVSGVVSDVLVAAGATVAENLPVVLIDASEDSDESAVEKEQVDLNYIRPDLQESFDRHLLGMDESRLEAVAKRYKVNHRTARENLADLMDEGSFIEYGSLTIAAQRRRRSLEDLMKNTPADGMVTGIGSVNKALFPEDQTQCVLMSYDYMVLAGTQGHQNHRKKDRMFEIAMELKLPVVLFAEGGGGRPGDTDGAGIAGLDCLAFELWGELSGLVPRIGIVAGRCFAGNAALLGASDVVIATADANIGMGGPAMIEGGGLGIYTPDEVGPMSVQVPNGVVDIAVENEAEAVSVARKYLSYFQGTLKDWTCQDQRKLRHVIPENRLRIYDIRELIDTLFDDDSVLELRASFGLGMITAFARIEGRPIGVIANNPGFLSGAIDSDGADKAARFLQLCDAFDIPVVSLCDTPGIMVGPDVEKTALVRHAARMFVTATSLTIPFMTVVLRKGYGLGAQAMAGGSFKSSLFTVTWPTGEFGGMGLEGAVKLGYRKELEAIEDPEERQKAFQERVDRMYEHGKAVNYATAFELDEVIDPMETRRWIIAGLDSAPKPVPREGKKRPFVDTW